MDLTSCSFNTFYNHCYNEVARFYDVFKTCWPRDNHTYYYRINEFFLMLVIVSKHKKQFGKHSFTVHHGTTETKCLTLFFRQFPPAYYYNYKLIVQEWIKRCQSYIFNIETNEDVLKIMPFTEELIFVLFNFFATHEQCLCNIDNK